MHSRHSACAARIAYVLGARPSFVKMAPVISKRLATAVREAHSSVLEGVYHG
jgi:UDP-N-acetylglucosamine 2-epimerase